MSPKHNGRGSQKVRVELIHATGRDVPQKQIANQGLDIVIDAVKIDAVIGISPVIRAIALHILVEVFAQRQAAGLLHSGRRLEGSHPLGVLDLRDTDVGFFQCIKPLGERSTVAGNAINDFPAVPFFYRLHLYAPLLWKECTGPPYALLSCKEASAKESIAQI